MKCKHILTITLALLLTASAIGCGVEANPRHPQTTTLPATSIDIIREPQNGVTTSQANPPIEGTVSAVTQITTAPDTPATVPSLLPGEGQGEHNVVLTLHSQQENTLYFDLIANYDAQLRTDNWWYLLEYWQDGQWVTLHSREQAAPYHNAVVSTLYNKNPIPGVPFAARVYCDLGLLSDVTLSSGHYRITKMFNDEEYTVECDLTFDTPLVIPKKSGPLAIPE